MLPYVLCAPDYTGASQPSMLVLGDSTFIYEVGIGREGLLIALATHAYTHVLPTLRLGRTTILSVLPHAVYTDTVTASDHVSEHTLPCTYLPECLIPMTQTQRSYW
jgi:hypothetical protein